VISGDTLAASGEKAEKMMESAMSHHQVKKRGGRSWDQVVVSRKQENVSVIFETETEGDVHRNHKKKKNAQACSGGNSGRVVRVNKEAKDRDSRTKGWWTKREREL